MAKQGQHKNDSHDQTKSKGHNNPSRSMTITAGTPKKKETYAAQGRRHEDSSKQAQAQRNTWNEDTRDKPSIENSPRARASDIAGGRSGSDSNASRRTRGLAMSNTKPRPGSQHPEEWRRDLNPNPAAGQNYGTAGTEAVKSARTAYDLKEIHRHLSAWPDDDLKEVPIVPEGQRLEQGATYIDLASAHPEEFTARGDMSAGPENCYVPKSEMDYALWNRLIGVQNPERTGAAG